MGALLYRWSTAAQLGSVLMIALFYATLARSLKRAELAWWARSWWSNALALLVAVSYWFFTPADIVGVLMRAAYVGAKCLYAVLLVQGARSMCRPGSEWIGRRTLAGIALTAIVLGAFLLTTIDQIGVVVQGSMGVLFLWTAVWLFNARGAATSWLAAGFLLRGGFACVEAIAYAAEMLPAGALSPRLVHLVQTFLGAHSAIDLGGDWLLALGGVLAITQRAQSELESANTDLLNVQAQLRNLADRDPLTGLANRRALPEAFRAVFSSGAVFVFFDLDSFKLINDTFGHAAGDASLVRFAAELRKSFRPTDCIIRYAGDEFVVIAASMDSEIIEGRIAGMRDRLGKPDAHGVSLFFSAGLATMAKGGDAEAALHAADAAMYVRKSKK